MSQIGELEPSGLPLKITNATIENMKRKDGTEVTTREGNNPLEVLTVTFSRTTGDRKGEEFSRSYATFRKWNGTTFEGKVSGPAARFIRQAAKLMGQKTVTDTDVLLGRVFLFENVEKTNKTTGKTFSEYYPVAVAKTPEANLAASDNR